MNSSVLHAGAGVALLVVGFLALAAPKQARSRHPRLGQLYVVLLALTLGSGMAVGATDPALSVFEIVTPPTFALGVLGFVAARLRRPIAGRPWVAFHIAGMAGSYIGVVTATLFQVVPRFLPMSPALAVALGVLPSVVGTLLIRRAIARRVRAPAPSARAVIAVRVRGDGAS